MTAKSIFDKCQRWIYKALLIICGIMMGLLSYAGMMSFFSSDSVMRLFCIPLIPVFLLFVVFIHEIGHALAAWALKYRVHFIAVGGFGFNPETGKFQKVIDYSENELAGFVQCSPQWPLKARWREIFVSFAGPLATIALGLLLLWLDKHFGTRTVNFSAPRHIPTVVNQTGETFYSLSEGYARKTVQHDGFLFLALVSFLDATFNLLPLKFGDTHDNDGRSIFKSFFKSRWSVESWSSARVSIANYYKQSYCSDEEWREFRKQCWYSHDADLEDIIRHMAWVKTDPAAFIAITNIEKLKANKTPNHVRWQYVVCSVLLGEYSQNLHQLMPEKIDQENIIYHFATVLLAHGSGQKEAITHAIKEARETYLEKSGVIPDEEESIFRAIENGQALPMLVWGPQPFSHR